MTVFHINIFINPVFDFYFRYLIRSITFRKKLFFLCLQNGSNIYSPDISSCLWFLPFTRYTPVLNRDSAISDITNFLSKAKLFGSVRRSNPIHLQGKPGFVEFSRWMQAATWEGQSMEFNQGSCNLILLLLFSLEVLNRFQNLIIS